MVLSRAGHIVFEEWRRVAVVRPEVVLDAFVVMPDHFHAIVTLPGRTSSLALPTGLLTRRPRSLGSLVAQFKAVTTRRVSVELARTGQLWQRNYHDRIIRDNAELERVRAYIRRNPAQWGVR